MTAGEAYEKAVEHAKNLEKNINVDFGCSKCRFAELGCSRCRREADVLQKAQELLHELDKAGESKSTAEKVSEGKVDEVESMVWSGRAVYGDGQSSGERTKRKKCRAAPIGASTIVARIVAMSSRPPATARMIRVDSRTSAHLVRSRLYW